MVRYRFECHRRRITPRAKQRVLPDDLRMEARALATTLELQESLVAHEKCTLKRPCCTHPDCLVYNELILDSGVLQSHEHAHEHAHEGAQLPQAAPARRTRRSRRSLLGALGVRLRRTGVAR